MVGRRGADHRARGALGRGQNPVAARPHGPRTDDEQGVRAMWSQKNPNRVVVEEKVLHTGSLYKSEFTVTKMKNKELENLYDELYGFHRMISRATSAETATEGMDHYNRLMKMVMLLRSEIEENSGMALPVPKKLKKAPKPKLAL